MLTKEKLEARLTELQQAAEQTAAQHNALVGRMEETKFLLSQFDKIDEISEDAVQSS